MFCSKFGGECPHTVIPDDKFVFVMMPFKNFDSVYYIIKEAVKGIEEKEFICERADKRYTSRSIWCDRICKNIRKSKYLIVDTTGRNPNVFYELGFAHAMGDNTKAIIITQNIEEAPFDVRELGHIIYSEKKLPKLRKDLEKAILDLEKEEVEGGYIPIPMSDKEMINDLKFQLIKEEERAAQFKKEVLESEERERELKDRIREMEAIRDNPVEEAKNKIVELEGTIAELKSKLKLTEKDKKETIEQISKTLKEKEEKLKIREEEFGRYKESKDVKALLDSLMDEAKRRAESDNWFNKANFESKKGNEETAIKYYTKAIELNPEFVLAYNNRGISYRHLKKYDKAIKDYTKAIDLDPEYAMAYNNRGFAYVNLKEYKKAMRDSNKAIDLDPKNGWIYNNLSRLHIILGNYKNALKTIAKTSSLSLEIKERAVCLYLECITKKILDIDISDCERELNEILEKYFTTTWSFDVMESWLEDANISDDKKSFIIEKTEQLKKHKEEKFKTPGDLVLDIFRKRSEYYEWFDRAYNESQKGEKETAIKYYTKAIELIPNEVAYNNRGESYKTLKKYEEARRDYTKAIELNTLYSLAYQNLSELEIITGNYKNALKNITNSLSYEIEDGAKCLYLECIAKKMLDMDTSDCEKEFNEILKKHFTITWSFDPIESWLKDSDITSDKKSFIIEKTEQLKKHKR